jgi:hypothetical protein
MRSVKYALNGSSFPERGARGLYRGAPSSARYFFTVFTAMPVCCAISRRL